MLPLLHHCLLALMVASARAADDSSLEFELNNGNKFPAVGLGIGNMQRDRIPSVLGTAMLQHGVRRGVDISMPRRHRRDPFRTGATRGHGHGLEH